MTHHQKQQGRKTTAVILFVFSLLFIVFGCATIPKKSTSYYLSDEYFNEIRQGEDPWVMEYFFKTTEYIAEKKYDDAIEAATEGINKIPSYRDLFSYFYTVRGYSYIMRYELEKGKEDIGYLENIDKDSLMIPFLYTYYYLSYAPFDRDPDKYYQKALDYLNMWKTQRPKTYFETFFSDPARIADIEKTIRSEMNK
jgi:tetratricopeptide (TPR) repeat protein